MILLGYNFFCFLDLRRFRLVFSLNNQVTR